MVPFESADFGENGTFCKNGEYSPKSLQKWSMFKSEILKRFESQIETERDTFALQCKSGAHVFLVFHLFTFSYFRGPSIGFRPAFIRESGLEFLQPVVYIQTVFILSKRTSQSKK